MASALPPGWLPPEEFVPTLPHGIAYASFLFTDADGRVLALRSVLDASVLNFPGGLLDPGEDLLGCARRETVEELGFLPADARRAVPRLLVLSFTAPRPPWPWKVGAVFDGGVITDEEIGRIVLDPTEHTGYALRNVEEWAAVADERRARILYAAMESRRTGRAVYLAPDDLHAPTADS
ncbi:NUDIX domain-containing protein [Kitasatospora sp. NPDC050543]|uniref:NUDIX domain-containing protein n=1 Tax=Kitasatospora sp. NPDC050543 TaxID=3364054 RepID=UPI0037B8D7F9